MSCIQKLLHADEKIVAESSISMAFVLIPSLLVILIPTGGTYLLVGPDMNWLFWPGILSVLAASITFYYRLQTLLTVELGVTTRRIIVKSGLIGRYTTTIYFDNLEGLFVEQGVLARLFNYGTIVLSGSGDTELMCPGIANPHKLNQQINESKTTYLNGLLNAAIA